MMRTKTAYGTDMSSGYGPDPMAPLAPYQIPFPNGKAPSMDRLPMAAIAGGDIHAALVREIRRTLKESRDSPRRAVRTGLDRLTGMELISADDHQRLRALFDHAFAAERGKMPPQQAFIAVRRIYLDMVASGSSDVALAMASSVCGAFAVAQTPEELPPGVLALSRSDAAGVGALAGIAAGAVIGGVIGGGPGAIIGGVVGGIVGGTVGLCVGSDEPDPSGNLGGDGGPAEPAPA